MQDFCIFMIMIMKLIKGCINLAVRMFNYIYMKWSISNKILRLRDENIRRRMVSAESSLLMGGIIPLRDSDDAAMLLAGETHIIESRIAFPICSASGRFRNTLISGGGSYERSLALVRACEAAYAVGLPVILIHAGNIDLESLIAGNPACGIKHIISPRSCKCVYDPLLGMTCNEAANALISSSENSGIRGSGNCLILAELIAELFVINSRGKHGISLLAFLRNDPADILKMIQNAQTQGFINNVQAMNMTRKYNAAQGDIYALSAFLNTIKSKLRGFYPSSGSIPPAVNAESAIRRKAGIAVDIISSDNGELFRMILSCLRVMCRNGLEFAAFFSDINICGHGNALLDYATESGRQFAVSSKDIVSDASTNAQGGSSNFDRIAGYADDFVYFRHTANSYAVSQKLGTYERWNISYHWDADHHRVIPNFTTGVAAAMEMNAKRVHSRIIQSLHGRQMVYHTSDTNQIYIMDIN